MPPSSGAMKRPSGAGSFSGFGIGSPFLSTPERPVCRAEGNAQQILPVGAVEDEEVAVARGLHQHLARLAVKIAVDQHRRLDRVPVVSVVRRSLKGPCQLAVVRMDCHDAAGVEIVAGAGLAVQHRRGISGAPVDEIQIGIIGAGHPGHGAGGAVWGSDRRQSCPIATSSGRSRDRRTAEIR